MTKGWAVRFMAYKAGFGGFASAFIPGVITGLFFFIMADGANGGIGTGTCAVPSMAESISLEFSTNRTGLGRCTGSVYPTVSENFSFCFFTDFTDFGTGAGCVCPVMIRFLALGFLTQLAGFGGSAGCVHPFVGAAGGGACCVTGNKCQEG